MTKNPLLVPGLLSLSLWGCSFGDRSVLLTIERPLGDPQIPRGISVVLEMPQDRRPEPHDVVGSVRRGVGVKTADIFSDGDVREWIHQAMTQELQHAGFMVVSSSKRGLALRVTTEIRDLSCEEGIGFRRFEDASRQNVCGERPSSPDHENFRSECGRFPSNLSPEDHVSVHRRLREAGGEGSGIDPRRNHSVRGRALLQRKCPTDAPNCP